jgi:hypothetical protein
MSTQDSPTAFVSAYDDLLQMLAAIEQLDAGEDRLSDKIASGLTLERREFALKNLARLLVTTLENELERPKAEIFDSVRLSIISTIAGGDPAAE